MNQITVAGIIGKDSETRYTPGGDPVANFSIADSQGKDKDTIWWNCSIFGKRAETLGKYLTKGAKVTVIGGLTQSKYTDKNGAEKISLNLRVSELALQGKKEEHKEEHKEEQNDIPF